MTASQPEKIELGKLVIIEYDKKLNIFKFFKNTALLSSVTVTISILCCLVTINIVFFYACMDHLQLFC